MSERKDDTGPITDDEARQILSRFNASHWRNPTEHARYSIPADPSRDDDIRLGAYIQQTAAMRAELEAVRAKLSAVSQSLAWWNEEARYPETRRLVMELLTRISDRKSATQPPGEGQGCVCPKGYTGFCWVCKSKRAGQSPAEPREGE
jgi:hypothetical protein